MVKPQNIKVSEAAKIIGKSQQFVRIGLQRKLFPFGVAIQMSSKWTYHISPKLLKEYVGIEEGKPDGRLVTLFMVCNNKENGGISGIKHFYDSNDVKNLLDLNSIRTARYRMQAMNDELKEQGFWIERG